MRDWLVEHGLKGKEVELPKEIIERTTARYREAYEMLVGKEWDAEVKGQGTDA